ncbi:MAG: peptidase S1 [Gammaproteobacteria bacterium SG8_11]|nr:MAG: peptidase S1 [Gammaproteobacteria bacterium SG8_11]
MFQFCFEAVAVEFPDTIQKVKESIVGVGTVQKTRTPPAQLLGTGFVVGDGLQVITNAHVLSKILDTEHYEQWVVFVGQGSSPEIRTAELVKSDSVHDLALLQIKGKPLPALKLGDSDSVREGERYAFTGFPIGAVLGLYPATHGAMISSITPIVIPASQSSQLNSQIINRLRSPFYIFQLDATAYPGNSGSPLYQMGSGTVVGIINMVFVKESKETVLSNPSGISYAIPSKYIKILLNQTEID